MSAKEDYKTVLRHIKNIRASLDTLSAVAKPGHHLHDKVMKIKSAMDSDEDMTSDAAVLSIRKLIESCKFHFQYKPAFKLCSEFCHDQTVPKEPSLEDIQILMCYLMIMILGGNKADAEDATDDSSEGENTKPTPPVKESVWPTLPKRPASPPLKPVLQHVSIENMNATSQEEGAKAVATNAKPPAKSSVAPAAATKIRHVKYPHIRCKHLQLNNLCPVGIHCNFVHDESEFQNTGCLKRNICREWRDGTCPFNESPEKCAFAHGYEDMNQD